MSKIIVVYHSGYGHTKLQAEAVAKGANAEIMNANEVDWEKLESADAIIFGCPTYMGGVSADFKKFMDGSSKTWYKRGFKNKIVGGFTNANGLSGDKLSTLIQLSIFAMQHGMIWVGADLDANDRMGSFLGVMSQSENSPPIAGQNPPAQDMLIAENYGKRIAEITERFK